MDNVISSGLSAAFDRLLPITDAYATTPIEQGFNWNECFAQVNPGEWYLVVFRSHHMQGAEKELLMIHDQRAYHVARNSPGFIHYFMGVPTVAGNCLSFCLWNSQQEAWAASQLPEHQAAQGLAWQMYDYFTLERYRVRKSENGEVVFDRI